MPPVPESKTIEWVKQMIENCPIVMFGKSTCPFCQKLNDELSSAKIKFSKINIDLKANTAVIQSTLSKVTGISTVPQLFIHGNFIGDSTKSIEKIQSGDVQKLIDSGRQYNYDLVIIGGGSGGLAASKEAAKYGAKVAVLDFVQPTPIGTTWGLGGTCVNVGCIPKKLMHQAAVHSHNLHDAETYGWAVKASDVKHNWSTMVENVQNHILSLNFGYRTSLRTEGVEYLNKYGTLVDEHTIKCVDKSGAESQITARNVILATGERPRYPNVPGDRQCCITSDDLFSLRYNPGRTLVVGASYVALECAGFLAALGNDVTVMVRSILLRGFDQDMANRVGNYMESHGVKFVRECVPTAFAELKPAQGSQPGSICVTGQFVNKSGQEAQFQDTFDTVLLAIGRDPCTKSLNLDKVNVRLDKVGRVVCDAEERTSVNNIYAIGDIVSEKLQLTPVAIEAGRNLAQRLYAGSDTLTDYQNVATTVFTPLEYGAIGLSEEDAIKKYGNNSIEVYHSYFKPLEWTVSQRENNVCYAKLICVKKENERVVGFHYLGPNAGEVTQGFAIGFRLGATKEDFNRIIGIHPTCAEIFTTLYTSKSSGQNAEATGC